MITEQSEPSMSEAIEQAMSAEVPAEVAPPLEVAPDHETETQRADRARDDAGRFAKAAKDAAAAKKPEGIVPAAPPIGEPAPVETPKPEVVRAPQSLTPAEREAFAKAPPEIQAAIVRRERQQEVALMDASKSKQFAADFQRTIEPYMPLIRAGTGDPMKTVANLLQTAHVLQTAPAHQKAGLVAEIIRMYGVPIDALDAALAGQPGGTGAPAQGATFDREALLREAEQRVFGRVQQQAQETQRARVQTELATFAKSHEFFDDVRDTMGRLMQAELASDLESAYKDACARNPEISRVLAQREASKQAATGAQATQRARAASSSVKSSPATSIASGESLGNIEDDVAAAMASLGR